MATTDARMSTPGPRHISETIRQPDFFSGRLDPRLVEYWREQLRRWPRDVLEWRHSLDCTGWSMACQGIVFAELLRGHGFMPHHTFRRYWRFNERVQRWDRRHGC